MSNVLASDKANIERYDELTMKENRTSSEETELNNLKVDLFNKYLTAEHINFITDSISNMQNYYLNEVVAHLATLDVGALRDTLGLLSTLQTSDKLNLVSAVNEVKRQSNKNITDIDTVNSIIGILASLSTLKKDSIVNSINEINEKTNTHIVDKDNPHDVTATQVGAYSKAESDGVYLKGSGARVDVYTALLFTNGSSNRAIANVNFTKAYSSPPTILPANITQTVSYSDVIMYPFIFGVTTTGFSVRLETTGGANLGGQSAANIFMNFMVIGK
jgi:hypothetical protein